MLGQAGPTPFDLHFSVVGIPVRVHPLFWLLTILLASGLLEQPHLLAIWIACVFFSILIHELGHALTARRFGARPEIVLYAFGGYAQYYAYGGTASSARMQIIFNGPAAGFILYGVVFFIRTALERSPVEVPFYLNFALTSLEFCNLWWNLLNLIPVYPLDGGQLTQAFLTRVRPWDGPRLSLQISFVAAVAAAAGMFYVHQQGAALLFAFLAVQNYQALQSGSWR